MVQNQKNLSLVRNVEYPISETKSRTHQSITTFSGKPSVEKVQVSFLSRWTRTMRLCETMMVDNRVSVCCFFLVQQEGTSIHRTKGLSEHNSLGVTSCLVHSKKNYMSHWPLYSPADRECGTNMSWFVIRSEPWSSSGQSRAIRCPLLGVFVVGKGHCVPADTYQGRKFITILAYILADITGSSGYHSTKIRQNL